MSILIGICTERFCLLFGDTRRVDYDGDRKKVLDDETQRIFKVNERVLFGMIGSAGGMEALFAPLRGFQDKDAITMRLAVRATEGYLKRNLGALGGPRGYLVIGSDNRGRFCSHELRADPETGAVETTVRQPELPDEPYSVACMLPPDLAGDREGILQQIGRAARDAGDPEELAQRVCRLIREISKKETSVGKNINVYMIGR